MQWYERKVAGLGTLHADMLRHRQWLRRLLPSAAAALAAALAALALALAALAVLADGAHGELPGVATLTLLKLARQQAVGSRVVFAWEAKNGRQSGVQTP